MQQKSKLNSVSDSSRSENRPSSVSDKTKRRAGSATFTASIAQTFNRNVWRPPGHFEIPDILGHAFLKPEPHTPIELRPLDVSKHISTKPWYPPNPYYQIPSLASPSRASSKK